MALTGHMPETCTQLHTLHRCPMPHQMLTERPSHLMLTCRTGALGAGIAMAAVLYTAGSIVIPSLASVFNELALKRSQTSLDVQNLFLYSFGLLFNLLGLLLMVALGTARFSTLFQGHSKVSA